MNFLEKMRRRYPDLHIGWSGHEAPDNLDPVKIAVAKGAKLLERHVGVPTDEITLNGYSMNPEQVEHFRKILTDWKSELMAKVDETVHHMQDEAANFPDPNDRATQESDFTMELRTRDRERKLIKKIEESLNALDADDYGYCASCGIEVGIRRLEARPTATECIDCKTLNEIKEKQYGK